MNSDYVSPVQSPFQSPYMEVECSDRWQVYHRLQELGIPCQCRAHKALKAFITNPTDALLLWSVVRTVSSTKSERIECLERCWTL